MTCPVCGQDDQHYLQCQYAGCLDGRHRPTGQSPWANPPEVSAEDLPVNAEGPVIDPGAELFKQLCTVHDLYPPEPAAPGVELSVRLQIVLWTGVVVLWGFAFYGIYTAFSKLF